MRPAIVALAVLSPLMMGACQTTKTHSWIDVRAAEKRALAKPHWTSDDAVATAEALTKRCLAAPWVASLTRALGRRPRLRLALVRDATAEAIDRNGWFHTGDIGEIDANGFLRITDRKKDIIVTAGGKNVAPQNIENLLKLRCPYVSHVVVHGDKRNFCSALVTINEEETAKWARENGISYNSYADLAERPEVRDLVQAGIDTLNSELASYETIKKFAILEQDLSLETGELTPKMSVKRRVVEKKYQRILDGFYSGTVEKLT